MQKIKSKPTLLIALTLTVGIMATYISSIKVPAKIAGHTEALATPTPEARLLNPSAEVKHFAVETMGNMRRYESREGRSKYVIETVSDAMLIAKDRWKISRMKGKQIIFNGGEVKTLDRVFTVEIEAIPNELDELLTDVSPGLKKNFSKRLQIVKLTRTK